MNDDKSSLALEAAQPQSQLAPQPALLPDNPDALLRFAIENKSGMEIIERLSALTEQRRAQRAKEIFDNSLAAFQAECPIIKKTKAVYNRDGQSVRYHYAPLDAIIAQVGALLKENGFSWTIDTVIADKLVKAVCTVKCAGHETTSEFQVPIDVESHMNLSQRYASALTFAKRYAFCNAFGILTADEDTDGATTRPKVKGPSAIHGDAAPTQRDASLKRELVSLTASVHGCKGAALTTEGKAKLTQWLIDEMILTPEQNVTDLTGEKLENAVAKVKKKLSGGGK